MDDPYVRRFCNSDDMVYTYLRKHRIDRVFPATGGENVVKSLYTSSSSDII